MPVAHTTATDASAPVATKHAPTKPDYAERLKSLELARRFIRAQAARYYAWKRFADDLEQEAWLAIEYSWSRFVPGRAAFATFSYRIVRAKLFRRVRELQSVVHSGTSRRLGDVSLNAPLRAGEEDETYLDVVPARGDVFAEVEAREVACKAEAYLRKVATYTRTTSRLTSEGLNGAVDVLLLGIVDGEGAISDAARAAGVSRQAIQKRLTRVGAAFERYAERVRSEHAQEGV